MTALAMWWALLRNEWQKFRRRRRVGIGLGLVVVFAAVVCHAYAGPRPIPRAQMATYDRQAIAGDQASIAHQHGLAQIATRANLLLQQYDLAQMTHRPLPPLAPIVRITHQWMALARHGSRVNNSYGSAVRNWKRADYAAVHHLQLKPFVLPRGGWPLVSQVFSSTDILLFALIAVVLTADLFGMEHASGTFNRLWLDPAPRGAYLLAKASLGAVVAVATALASAILLYAAGTVLFGTPTGYAVLHEALTMAAVHTRYGLLMEPQVLHAAQVGVAGLVPATIQAVLGSLLPLLAVVSVAMGLGYAIHQGPLAVLLAAGFTVGPALMLAGPGAAGLSWVPGSYLAFGQIQSVHTTAVMLHLSPARGLAASVGWAGAAPLAVWWRQRRAEL